MLAAAFPRWSSTLVQLKRDLAMVRRQLTGVRSSPVRVTVVTPARAPVLATHAAPRELIVDRVIEETHDVTTLVLRDPAGAPFTFEAGQFFTLLAPLVGDGGGAIVPRNYSASNAPGQAELHVTIKRKPGGRVSGTLVALTAGERISVLGPFGTFTARRSSATEARHLVLIAGGVGITPLLSILRTVLTTEPSTHITLVYGNRTERDIAFASALDELAATHPERLAVVHVLETCSERRPSAQGRLDRANVERILHGLAIAGGEYLVCGPEPMQEEVVAALEARGVAAAHIQRERFTIGSARATPRARDLDADARRVTILSADRLIKTTALPGASLLEAGLSASAPMPFSCGVGGCGACRVRLVDGEVDLDEPHCLSEEERAAGYVLACVGRPRGACTIEITGDREEGGR